MSFIPVLIFVLIIVMLYIVTYLLNKKTKPPFEVDISSCGGCHVVECNHHPSHRGGGK